MSNSPKVERKLAAIMFTDIAGFTESMSYDEQQAMNAVKKKRSIIQPLIKEHNGVFVKEIGDGTLSYFSSAIDASTCAVKLQELTYDEEHLNIRVGLHIGDIVFDGQDVFGEGVNIASRLESLSPVGGVCVSKTVYDELENKKEFNGTSLGLQSLKGVGRLVEVYALKGDKLKEPDASKYKETEVQKHTDDEVPSIAIVPFENKGAAEDVFYAYGISADLISDCSSAGLIRVASLKRVEEVDDLSLDEKAKKLNVRYTAEGTLWKMGEMFQLSIELYDTKESKVVWSDRWQEKWDNLPTIKGILSDGLLKALDTTSKEEKKVQSINPDAYELYLKAKHKYEKRVNTDDTEIVRGLLNKAIELDDNLILAKMILGHTYLETGDYDKAMDIYIPALNQADELGEKSEIAQLLNTIGIIHFYRGDYKKELEYYESSLKIFNKIDDKSGMAVALNNIGAVVQDSEHKRALNYYKRAHKIYMELEDKLGMVSILNNIGKTYQSNSEYDKAREYYENSLRIVEQLNNKDTLAICLGNKGSIYIIKGDFNQAVDCYKNALVIFEELGQKRQMGFYLYNIGKLLDLQNDVKKALEYYERALAIFEELGEKRGVGMVFYSLGKFYFYKENYEKSLKYIEKALRIEQFTSIKEKELETTTYFYLVYKHLGKEFDEKEIHTLIKETENIEFELNFVLYKLLEDKFYLKTTYKQIQEKVGAMDEELKEKFLNYPIPKQITEEYNKVFS